MCMRWRDAWRERSKGLYTAISWNSLRIYAASGVNLPPAAFVARLQRDESTELVDCAGSLGYLVAAGVIVRVPDTVLRSSRFVLAGAGWNAKGMLHVEGRWTYTVGVTVEVEVDRMY